MIVVTSTLNNYTDRHRQIHTETDRQTDTDTDRQRERDR